MAEVPRDSAPKGAESFDVRELLDSHGDRLLRSAFLLCGNESDAQDLVQETFVQAIQSQRNFRGESALYTWLHGILLNVCRRHRRKQKRLIYDEELVLKEIVPPDEAGNLDQDFCAAGLTKALRQLSHVHREVVILRYFEDMKIGDIARETGASVGTVKSRLHYAVRCLEQFVPKEMNLFASGDTHKTETR